MEILIHKGTDEIGGNCVEISTKNTKILIDYGTPIKKESKQVNINSKIDALLLSHSHPDHIGEINKIDAPIFCSKITNDLIKIINIFNNKNYKNKLNIFEESFFIKDIKITPIWVDHSAIDAYAFLIEADNQKILYTGDFRNSGRKKYLFNNLKSYKNIDALIVEGTLIDRKQEIENEEEVEKEIRNILQNSKNIAFLISSGQNIDRIVSAYKATKDSSRVLVIDIYTAYVLENMKKFSKHLPTIDWKKVKVYKPTAKIGGYQYGKLKDKDRDFVKKVFKKQNIITFEDMKKAPSNYLIKISPSYIEEVLNILKLNEADIIYSMWKGYQDDETSKEIYNRLKNNYNFYYAHTSGHADTKTLKELVKSLNPEFIIPIHTENKQKFREIFSKNVLLLDDGIKINLGDEKMKKNITDGLLNSFLNEKEPLWNEKIKQDCKKGEMFLSVRDERITIYYKGGRIFEYDKNGFKTHIKYAAVIDGDKDYLTEKELKDYKLISDFKEGYSRIKENCKNYAGEESKGVAKLYEKFSYLTDNDIIVLDIEVSFEAVEDNKQDRIDILLFDKNTKTLQFVEAKHFSNSEIWSTKEPKVISQIKRYEKQIKDKSDEIIETYKKHIDYINKIFDINLPYPEGILPNVALFIFGFDNDQKSGKLSKLILNNKYYKDIKGSFIGNVNNLKVETLWESKSLYKD